MTDIRAACYPGKSFPRYMFLATYILSFFHVNIQEDLALLTK